MPEYTAVTRPKHLRRSARDLLPPMITARDLRERLHYDPETGVFTWRTNRRSDLVGMVAGCVSPDGYVIIAIGPRRYMAHRLAWLYTHGRWPRGVVDHINRVRDDNRRENLRDATSRRNARNSTPYTGPRKIAPYS